MKRTNKIFSMVLAIAMVIGMMTTAVATESATGGVEKVVSQYVEALNESDWNGIISMSPNEDYQENFLFYNNEENKENSIGFFSVTAASLTTIVELDSHDLYDYTNADHYFDNYESMKLYLTGIDLSVDKESKYFYNGVNFFLITLGQKDGVWKVVLFSQAPASMIEENIITAQTRVNDASYASSYDVSKALEIIRARYQGVILNGEGNIIDTNIATAEQIAEEKG